MVASIRVNTAESGDLVGARKLQAKQTLRSLPLTRSSPFRRTITAKSTFPVVARGRQGARRRWTPHSCPLLPHPRTASGLRGHVPPRELATQVRLWVAGTRRLCFLRTPRVHVLECCGSLGTQWLLSEHMLDSEPHFWPHLPYDKFPFISVTLTCAPGSGDCGPAHQHLLGAG